MGFRVSNLLPFSVIVSSFILRRGRVGVNYYSHLQMGRSVQSGGPHPEARVSPRGFFEPGAFFTWPTPLLPLGFESGEPASRSPPWGFHPRPLCLLRRKALKSILSSVLWLSLLPSWNVPSMRQGRCPMHDSPGPSSIPQAWLRPPTGAEQMLVGRGMGVWVEATSKQHRCDPEPPAGQKQCGVSEDPKTTQETD